MTAERAAQLTALGFDWGHKRSKNPEALKILKYSSTVTYYCVIL
jgi:hypothetical protein